MVIQRVWQADRKKLLNQYAELVAKKLYSKLPYPFWRKLSSNPDPILTIEYENNNNEISLHADSLILVPEYKSFGRFLLKVFNNSEYTYKPDKITAKVNLLDGDLTCATDVSNIIINTVNNTYDKVIANSTVCNNLEDKIKEIAQDILNNKEKEENMTTSKMFNFDFGPVSGQKFRMSPYGLAVNTSNNGWVAYNNKTGELINVDIVNFDISKMIYKMPVAESAIAAGDILMHGGKPMFVRNVNTNGTVEVIDYTNASVSNILPVKSPFGFNFYTKVCSLFNLGANATANADNPFGNMLPFFMLTGENDGELDPTMLIMASMMNNGNMDFSKNPMMMYLLMNRKDKNDILPFLMMMNGGLTGMSVSTPTSSTPTVTATT